MLRERPCQSSRDSERWQPLSPVAELIEEALWRFVWTDKGAAIAGLGFVAEAELQTDVERASLVERDHLIVAERSTPQGNLVYTGPQRGVLAEMAASDPVFGGTDILWSEREVAGAVLDRSVEVERGRIAFERDDHVTPSARKEDVRSAQ